MRHSISILHLSKNASALQQQKNFKKNLKKTPRFVLKKYWNSTRILLYPIFAQIPSSCNLYDIRSVKILSRPLHKAFQRMRRRMRRRVGLRRLCLPNQHRPVLLEKSLNRNSRAWLHIIIYLYLQLLKEGFDCNRLKHSINLALA